jgi:hypothetical protein
MAFPAWIAVCKIAPTTPACSAGAAVMAPILASQRCPVTEWTTYIAQVEAMLLAIVPSDMPGKKVLQYQIPVLASLAMKRPYPTKPPRMPIVYDHRGRSAMIGYRLSRQLMVYRQAADHSHKQNTRQQGEDPRR